MDGTTEHPPAEFPPLTSSFIMSLISPSVPPIDSVGGPVGGIWPTGSTGSFVAVPSESGDGVVDAGPRRFIVIRTLSVILRTFVFTTLHRLDLGHIGCI